LIAIIFGFVVLSITLIVASLLGHRLFIDVWVATAIFLLLGAMLVAALIARNRPG